MKLLFLALMLICINAYSQDSTKHDTIPAKKEYIFFKEVTDTIPVKNLLYLGEKGIVRWVEQGWYIRKYQLSQDGKLNTQPIIIGALIQTKKKFVKPVL